MRIDATSRRSPHLRLVLRLSLVAGLLVSFLVGIEALSTYRRYSRFVDRRLMHNRVYMAAANPALERLRPRAGRLLAVDAVRVPGRQRRVPAYEALPPRLVQAVVAIEDRRFFEHAGLDYKRTISCALQDALTFRIACGGSTLTQQVARASLLSSTQTLHRKLAEMVIAKRLEERLNKQQIFAIYAAQIDLGQNGQRPVRGFRQGAAVYFRKDLRQLDLTECALLAGMVHAPNFDNPYRHPDRALHRRNIVLDAMVTTGAVSRSQADAAKAEPLDLALLAPETPSELELSFPG